jgi:hypothetical protein
MRAVDALIKLPRLSLRNGCRSAPTLKTHARATEPTAEGTLREYERVPRAGTRGHWSWAVSFVLRGFRARGFPALPSLPASSLDGKEGLNDSGARTDARTGLSLHGVGRCSLLQRRDG